MVKIPSDPKQKRAKINLDADAVRQLSELLKETDLSEIEYEAEGCRIRVARQSSYAPMPSHFIPQMPAAGVSAPVAAPTAEVASVNPESHPGLVRSPMVGTAYLSPKPGDPAFVSVGSPVAVGQTLMILEAMKVMNPLKASKAGKVTQILIEDGQPVEFDEPLLIIE
ncbi:MAG: acetyl-CoA carboxylase biotin carboxyl carrier protein [Alphaproteobacteria bacterium]